MKTYNCLNCGNAFGSYNPNPIYCSVFCKSEGQSPDVDIERLRILYIAGKTQNEIAAIFGVSQKSIFKAMKRHGIKARKAAKRSQTRENNSSWKGDEAGKQAFHRRLYARYGKPRICGVCGTTKSSNYDYANLTGNYQDIEDYLPMCRSCHWKYDKKIMNIKHMREVIKNAGE